MKKIISFNIIRHKDSVSEIINPTDLYPTLFYYDVSSSYFSKEIFCDKKFIDFANKTLLNVSTYTFSKIYYVEYDIDTKEVVKKNIQLQNAYSMSEYSLEELAHIYIIDILNELYKSIYNTYYTLNNDVSNKDLIITLYKTIYDDSNVSKETFDMYIHSIAQQKYNMTEENIKYLCDIFLEII